MYAYLFFSYVVWVLHHHSRNIHISSSRELEVNLLIPYQREQSDKECGIFLTAIINFFYSRVSLAGTNIRSERKYIVFFSQLFFFQFCQFCKTDNPAVEVTESGTNVTVKTRCRNDKCKKESTGHSQPFLPGSFIHAANFLLPLAVVLSGVFGTKVVNRCAHMGLGCIFLKTFFKHQRVGTIIPHVLYCT